MRYVLRSVALGVAMVLGGGCWSSDSTTMPTTLASGHWPGPIAVDATSVYWANLDDGTVMKVGLGGGTPTTLGSGTGSRHRG
jgi:hypothetical protein